MSSWVPDLEFQHYVMKTPKEEKRRNLILTRSVCHYKEKRECDDILQKNTTTVFILWFRNDVILHVTIGGQSTSFRNEFLDLVVSNFQPMRRLRISSLYIQNCSKPLKWKCFDIIHKSLFFVVTTQMYLTVVDLKGEMLQDLHFHVNRIFDLVLNPSYLLME